MKGELTTTDTSALREAAEKALVPYMGGDRPTTEPGGCDCQLCGAIFVGGIEHTTCMGCELQESFQRLANPATILALLSERDALAERVEERDFVLAIMAACAERRKLEMDRLREDFWSVEKERIAVCLAVKHHGNSGTPVSAIVRERLSESETRAREAEAKVEDLEGDKDELTEILHDLVMVDAEERAIGGGPGFKDRREKAWARARERFEP